MSLTRRTVLIGAGAVVATAALLPTPVAATPASKLIFLPDWRSQVFQYIEENTITNLYNRMEVWDFPNTQLRIVRVDSPEYLDLIAKHPPENGIPPHITFGGAVVAGKGDPTFHPRWEDRTRRHIASGKFAIIDGNRFTVRLDT